MEKHLKERNDLINKFFIYKEKDYSRKGLSFELVNIDKKLKEIAEIISMLVDYVPEEQIGRHLFDSKLREAINEYISVCNSILDFDPENNSASHLINKIRGNANKLFNDFFSAENGRFSNFPPMAYAYSAYNSIDSEIFQKTDEIKIQHKRAKKLVENIEDLTSEKFAHNYSQIFHKEAKKHSNPCRDLREWGSSEWFLILSGLALLVIALLIFRQDLIIPTGKELETILDNIKDLGISEITYTQLLLPYYIGKILVITLLLFILKFSVKQFNIHRNIYSQNVQRANSLDSFQFFYDQLGEQDNNSKQQYLLEVAKSVFAVKDAGYIKSEGEIKSLVENIKLGGS